MTPGQVTDVAMRLLLDAHKAAAESGGMWLPVRLIIDPFNWQSLASAASIRDVYLDRDRREWKGLEVKITRARKPPLAVFSAGMDGLVPFDGVVDDYPPLISIESEHAVSSRSRFFDWDGNPEGYK